MSLSQIGPEVEPVLTGSQIKLLKLKSCLQENIGTRLMDPSVVETEGVAAVATYMGLGKHEDPWPKTGHSPLK